MMEVSRHFDEIEQEFTPEPIARPMLGAIAFHLLIAGGALAFAFLQGLFPHNTWGGANDGSAIAVSLVSNALPLPADKKPNDNVLSTEHPSEAAAPPAPKAQATVDEKAIPIPTKIEAPKKPADKKQEAVKPLKPTVTPPPIATKPNLHPQPTPPPDNRAQFGEQSSSRLQRTTLPTTTSANGEVAVTSGSRGFNYPFYVEAIQRKMAQNMVRGEVDPRTPKGTQANILFTVRRDGSATDVKLDKSSGSPTLDRACLRAAQRVDTFGPLPSPTSDGNLTVSYYCEY
jgi:protein TonB